MGYDNEFIEGNILHIDEGISRLWRKDYPPISSIWTDMAPEKCLSVLSI